MVVIRLSRGGAKKSPFFNIVVADSRNRRDGRFIERVGFYNPSAKPETQDFLRVNQERLAYWTGNGAQLSDTVARLVKLTSKGAEGVAAAKAKEAEKLQAKKAAKAAAAVAAASAEEATAE